MNNLLIQEQGSFGFETTVNSPKRKRSRRSFWSRSNDNNTERYLSGKRVGPVVLEFPENDEKEMIFGNRESDHFLWCFLRSCASPKQFVPSWTGYNIVIHNDIPVLQSSIRYLDCIDAPATQVSTIFQV